jgi:hypothetical protein
MTMTTANARYIALHVLGAAAFIFVLNHFILDTGLQTSLTWGVVFGAMAGVLAWQQTKR